MKKVLCLLLACGQLLAEECCIDDPESRFCFAGEWLYFMPSFDQNEWLWDGRATFNAANFESARRGELQKYYSAFRLEGKYTSCNEVMELIGRYTNFRHSYSKGEEVPIGGPVLGFSADINVADLRYDTFFDRDYHYYNIEGLVGIHLPAWGCLESEASLGVKFVHLHIAETMRFNDNANGIVNVYNENMRSWAVGPAFSYDGLYSLWNCLGLTGRFLLGVLACESRAQLTQNGGNAAGENGLTAFVADDPNLWHVITSIQGRLGINYTRPCAFWCFKFHADLEGGYEMLSEGRLVARIITFDDVLNGFSMNAWSDFTLNGPYVRLNLCY